MSTLDRSSILRQTRFEEDHYTNSPHAFFSAWKRGAALAGPRLFGQPTHSDLEKAVSVWELRPDLQLISDSISPMTRNERSFLAAMVSIYNSQDGGRLLQRVGVHGLADLGGLDLQRRTVIAALILHYTPSW